MLGNLDLLEPLMTKADARARPRRRIPDAARHHTGGTTGLSSLRQQFSTPLFVLMLIVGVVLLIACANVASLVLSRSAAPDTRSSRCAWRSAQAAARLIRQLLIERTSCSRPSAAHAACALARWATGLARGTHVHRVARPSRSI